MTPEEQRLQESRAGSADWLRWGPYLGADGIAGICDREQKICFAVALWNGRDPTLTERLAGLCLMDTPTHSYMKFRCQELHADFDIIVEYAKGGINDILIRITAINRGPERAPLHLLPTVWFRDTWSGHESRGRPVVRSITEAVYGPLPTSVLQLDEPTVGQFWLYHEGAPPVQFCEASTAISAYVVQGRREALHAESAGTKAAIHYVLEVEAGARVALKLRLTDLEGHSAAGSPLGSDFDAIFAQRQREASSPLPRTPSAG